MSRAALLEATPCPSLFPVFIAPTMCQIWRCLRWCSWIGASSGHLYLLNFHFMVHLLSWMQAMLPSQNYMNTFYQSIFQGERLLDIFISPIKIFFLGIVQGQNIQEMHAHELLKEWPVSFSLQGRTLLCTLKKKSYPSLQGRDLPCCAWEHMGLSISRQ